MSASSARPVVFIGPSLAKEQAAAIVDAEYLPPARRGDFDALPAGAVVGLIDGVFDQSLAVSPLEIRQALERGVTVLGSSSMGALRANEVPGVIGVGKVFEMFRSGEIEDDDEVALSFDPESHRALSVPMVNVRHAVDRLVRPGTLSAEVGRQILRAAKRLWYPERVYPTILKEIGLWGRDDSRQLAAMLALHDLKRDDAVTLLERLRSVGPRVEAGARAASPASSAASVSEPLGPNPPVHCWEFGPPVPFGEVLRFLKLTGAFPKLARAAWGRGGAPLATDEAFGAARGALLQRLRTVWHWVTGEEVEVTLRQLGLDAEHLSAAVASSARETAQYMARARTPSERDLARLRVELFFDDAALKRETARLSSLETLAAAGRARGGALSVNEREAAADRLCACVDAPDEARAREYLALWGVSAGEVSQHLETLAWARRQAARLSPTPRARARSSLHLEPSPKVKGSKRFTWPLRRAQAHTRRLAPVIGVTRVAMITGLGNLGVPNAQAFRPTGPWSSTVGSGKSETVRGAKIGAVMEELEKWAQEQFSPAIAATSSYRSLVARGCPVIDPATLDLPYDSCYRPELELAWVEGDDLIGGRKLWVPAAAVLFERQPDDIFYSPHAGRKVSSTNGLASAFTLAEALTHGISEYVERHALISSDVLEANPGATGAAVAPLVDLRTVPRSSARLIRRLQRAGYQMRVRALSAGLAVPTFHATLLAPVGGALSYQEAWKEQVGHAAHPDPEVALNGAVLEAAQGIMSDIAGAREDLTLHARSLGRHERTKVRRWAAFLRARAPGLPTVSFDSVKGLVSSDAARDVRWLAQQLARAGFPHLCVFDLSHEALRPARVIRALVPGMDTVNPFYTGPRTQAGLLHDLLE